MNFAIKPADIQETEAIIKVIKILSVNGTAVKIIRGKKKQLRIAEVITIFLNEIIHAPTMQQAV